MNNKCQMAVVLKVKDKTMKPLEGNIAYLHDLDLKVDRIKCKL